MASRLVVSNPADQAIIDAHYAEADRIPPPPAKGRTVIVPRASDERREARWREEQWFARIAVIALVLLTAAHFASAHGTPVWPWAHLRVGD